MRPRNKVLLFDCQHIIHLLRDPDPTPRDPGSIGNGFNISCHIHRILIAPSCMTLPLIAIGNYTEWWSDDDQRPMPRVRILFNHMALQILFEQNVFITTLCIRSTVLTLVRNVALHGHTLDVTTHPQHTREEARESVLNTDSWWWGAVCP